MPIKDRSVRLVLLPFDIGAEIPVTGASGSEISAWAIGKPFGRAEHIRVARCHRTGLRCQHSIRAMLRSDPLAENKQMFLAFSPSQSAQSVPV